MNVGSEVAIEDVSSTATACEAATPATRALIAMRWSP